MNILNQFHWLVLLQRKYTYHVSPHLDELFSVIGPPDRLESGNGGEIKKEVIKVAKIYCFILIDIALFEVTIHVRVYVGAPLLSIIRS